jgi:hypothetical protein
MLKLRTGFISTQRKEIYAACSQIFFVVVLYFVHATEPALTVPTTFGIVVFNYKLLERFQMGQYPGFKDKLLAFSNGSISGFPTEFSSNNCNRVDQFNYFGFLGYSWVPK